MYNPSTQGIFVIGCCELRGFPCLSLGLTSSEWWDGIHILKIMFVNLNNVKSK